MGKTDMGKTQGPNWGPARDRGWRHKPGLFAGEQGARAGQGGEGNFTRQDFMVVTAFALHTV